MTRGRAVQVGTASELYELPRHTFVGNFIGSPAVMWLAAYWIRFNFDIPPEYLAASWAALAWLIPLYAVIYLKFGLYRGIWRYASMGDLRRLLIALDRALAKPSWVEHAVVIDVDADTTLCLPHAE